MLSSSATAAFAALFTTGDVRAASHRLRRLMWFGPPAQLLREVEFGWNDGGCLLLSDALTLLAGELEHEQQVVTRGTVRMCDHAVLEVTAGRRRWYTDASGIGSRRALLHRWSTIERLPSPRIVPLAGTPISAGIPRDPVFSERIAQAVADGLASAN